MRIEIVGIEGVVSGVSGVVKQLASIRGAITE